MAELFDLYDAEGRPLGRSKERELVHRDGDWHRSIHLWVVRPDGGLVFQRRSDEKDTWPGSFNASVGGHYAAGETLLDVVREAQEEIGIAVSMGELIPLGVWRYDDGSMQGILDREIQDVFFWPLATPLDAFQPDPVEVTGLAEVSAAGLAELLEGRVARLRCPYLVSAGRRIERIELAAVDIVPPPDYHLRIARAALDYARGAPLAALGT